MLRRVMESGAKGCEIIISGKLTGPRSRTEKFVAGYIKHSGKPADEIVDTGYSVAVKKLGVIGCQVRIIPPDKTPPDQFNITAAPQAPVEERPFEVKPAEPAATSAPAAAPVEEKKSELDALLESEPSQTPSATASSEVVEEAAPAQEAQPQAESEAKPAQE
jgi:small subunit ribosomal protein S3